jgi:serine protease Do
MSKKILTAIAVVFLVFLLVQPAQASFLDEAWGKIKSLWPMASTSSLPVAEPSQPISLYKPAENYEEAVVAAVEGATESVVSIIISKDVPIIENCPYNPFGNRSPFFEEFFGYGFEFSRPCETGTEKREVGGGSGFIVSENGLVITNKHVVIDEKAEYTVFTADGKKYPAKVLATDPIQDLALLQIEGNNFQPAKLGDSDGVKLGQTAIAIGNALSEYSNTVSVGVISGLARTVTAFGQGIGTETIRGVLQTDAAINPGNSGGPLLNLRGEVIGINTAMAEDAQNIGFAIPINNAKRAIQSVKATGKISVPYLGVRFLPIKEEITKEQKLETKEGAILRGAADGPAIIPDSPADKAGLLAEDIILEVNGQKITKERPLLSWIQNYSVGEEVTLRVWREGKELEIKVKLEERPKQ